VHADGPDRWDMQSSSRPDPLRWQQRRAFLVGVTAAAGWLDALAFLYLGKVFLSFMSGNLLFVGIAAGTGNADLLGRAGAALGAFLIGTAAGARITGSQLAPGAPRSPMTRTLRLEAALLALFAVLWLATGTPADHSSLSIALIVLGAGAMGLQAAVALAFHLPNVATVAMTATLAQLGALAGWRRREGSRVVARTPAASLMVALSLAYLIAAIVVATVPQTAAMALGPVLLLVLSLAIDARSTGHAHRAPVRAAAVAQRSWSRGGRST
jgi:uncharacterized membrane protein YoaK (UPF0700 family)